MKAKRNNEPSPLLLEEYFSTGDDRFLDELIRYRAPKHLATLADRWKIDPRPWARRQLLRYLEAPLNHPGHEPIVKRIFKHAEAQRDHELLQAFLHAFDRLVRRVRERRGRYDTTARGLVYEEYLYSPPNRVRQEFAAPRDASVRFESLLENTPGGLKSRRRYPGRLFTYRTRYYLRRRVWRYFRRLGNQRPIDYIAAVAPALHRYRDHDLKAGENILDCWSLLQITHGKSDVLEFIDGKVRLRENRTLGQLTPAPRFPALWRTPEAFDALLLLVSAAPARFVRVWAVAMLRREHAESLRKLPPQKLIALLDCDDPDVQAFAGELFAALPDLGRLGLDAWWSLLQTKNPQVLALICDAMIKNVAPQRLRFDQCVELTCAKPTPVARMGFDLLKSRKLASAEIRDGLPRLADLQCAAVGGDVAKWALEQVGVAPHYAADSVIGFFDSMIPEVRAAAIAWLISGSPGYDDPALWARLVETPFDDVRQQVLSTIERRTRVPGGEPDALAPIWCAVILGIHRGGRQKPRAVRQLAAAIAESPARVGQLAPVLAIAIRSIRGPERRAGLAAVAALVEQHAALADEFERLIPELRVRLPQGAAR